MNFDTIFNDFTNQLGEGQAFHRLAFDNFKELGIPGRRNEDWKYTNVEKWIPSSLSLPDWKKSSSDPHIESDFEHAIVLQNGVFREDLSNIPKGLKVRSLRKNPEAMSFHSDTFYRELKRDAFFHLGEAFGFDGLVIEVGRDQVIRENLEIIHVSDGGKMVPSRVLLKCDRMSQINVIERFLSWEEDYHFSNSITEIFAEAGAQVRYCQSQEENTQSLHIGHVNVIQNNDSHVNVLTSSLGGGLTRFNVNARLLGQGSRAVLNSLYLVEGSQHTDLCSVIDHAVPHCESEQLAKGILTDTGRAVFNGVIKIRQDAQKSNSSQLNNNLVLDQRAEVDTRPQLQIDADDVKAAHGATVGQLDPEQVFYLQSRAISKEESIKILGLGFADEVLFNFPAEDIRQVMQEKTRKKFAGFEVK